MRSGKKGLSQLAAAMTVAATAVLGLGTNVSYAALAAGSTPTVLFTRYTGGDATDGLALSGSYLYAVDVGKTTPGNTVLQGYHFTPLSAAQPSGTPGAAILGNDFNWGTYEATHGHPFNYGGSADDLAMQSLMESVDYAAGNPANTAIGFSVTPGQSYALQLFIPNDDNNILEFSVLVEGVALQATPFSTNNLDTGSNRDGTYLTTTFTLDDSATSSNLDINVFQAAGSATLVTVGAATLQAVPEPSSLGLLALGGVGLLGRRGRSRRR
jgi:hypothetical protein